MRKLPCLMLFLLLVTLSLPVWAYSETVMVTVVDVGMEPAKEATKENTIGLGNGLMDALFNNGIIFFTSSSRKSLSEMMAGRTSLVSATESGADYLVEISLEEEKQVILYGIYDIQGKDLLKKGEISVPDGTAKEKNEFCENTGMSIAQELFAFLNK